MGVGHQQQAKEEAAKCRERPRGGAWAGRERPRQQPVETAGEAAKARQKGRDRVSVEGVSLKERPQKPQLRPRAGEVNKANLCSLSLCLFSSASMLLTGNAREGAPALLLQRLMLLLPTRAALLLPQATNSNSLLLGSSCSGTRFVRGAFLRLTEGKTSKARRRKKKEKAAKAFKAEARLQIQQTAYGLGSTWELPSSGGPFISSLHPACC